MEVERSGPIVVRLVAVERVETPAVASASGRLLEGQLVRDELQILGADTIGAAAVKDGRVRP